MVLIFYGGQLGKKSTKAPWRGDNEKKKDKYYTNSRMPMHKEVVASSRLLCPWSSPGTNIPFSREDLPNPGIEPRSPALQENSLP